MRHCYATSILSLLVFTHGLAAADSPFAGQAIVSVRFEPAEHPIAQRELNEILPVKVAQEYSAAGIRDAIERLYATGRYGDIQVDASPAEGGLAIRFITKNSWFIGKVSTKGDVGEPPNAGQIVNASRLRLGDAFDMAAVPVAAENIRKLLVQNGYFDPMVEPEFAYDNAYSQVNITFALKTGKRASYLPPQVSGDTSVLSAKAITSATKWHRFLVPGYRGITLSRTRSGIDNVRLKYQNSNRLLATVVLDGIDEDRAANKGLPKIAVNPGPTVNVTTPGTSLSKRKLRENVPVFEERTVDNDLLTEGATNLRDYFQAQGYFDVSVEFKEQKVVNGNEEISYVIEKGGRHRFVYLDISGNKYFNQKTIRERLFLTPKSFAMRNGRYSEAFVKRDIETIKDLYESNGFRDAQVKTRVEDKYKGRSGDLAEFFTIEEGPQYLVSSLEIKGADKHDLTRMRQSLGSQPGQVFSEFNIASDRETIIPGVRGERVSRRHVRVEFEAGCEAAHVRPHVPDQRRPAAIRERSGGQRPEDDAAGTGRQATGAEAWEPTVAGGDGEHAKEAL